MEPADPDTRALWSEVKPKLARLKAAERVVATLREIVASPTGVFDMNAARRALERYDRSTEPQSAVEEK